jgi:osmotically-inducible protein OsmY
MNLRQVVVSGSLAAVIAAFSCVPAFAAQSPDAAPDATVIAGKTTGATKKATRAANRAFSKKVQKQLAQTKGLDQASIAAFGNAKTGQVTLAGQVASDDQTAIAVDAAKKVQGVTSVSSKLTLRQQGGG